jgi:hypothetical protein
VTILGLSGNLFPVHPHPFPDELLSSWIARIAYSNGLKVQAFASIFMGPDAWMWCRDIDRSATPELLATLSENTGSRIPELTGGMIADLEGKVFEQHNPNGNTDWVLPLGIRHRTRKSFGMQFCPLCLFLDEEPYYRRQWRLGFVTVCDKHWVQLLDRCPSCAASVTFFRNELGRRKGYHLGNLTSCWSCGFDLRRAPAVGVDGPDGKSISALGSLVTFADMGWWFQGSASLHYAPLYFDVLHHLVAYMLGARGRRLLHQIELDTGWSASLPEPKGRCVFEHQPVRHRHALVVAALWLLDDWPERFIRVMKQAKLTRSRILSEGQLPFWFESVLDEYLGAGTGNPGIDEAEQAAAYLRRNHQPVSRAAVSRIMGRGDALAAKAYALPKSSAPSREDYEQAILKMERDVATLEVGSVRRLLLQRDIAIATLLRLTGWPVRKVVGLTISDAIRHAKSSDDPTARKFGGIVLTYLRRTRRFLKGPESGEALFIGWRSPGIGVKNWGLRWGKYREKMPIRVNVDA